MNKLKGFTLIEVLTVIAIIGLLTGIVTVNLTGVRSRARDIQRKADLEEMQSALERYHSDCLEYPDTLGSSLFGDGSSVSCQASTQYMGETPIDPQSDSNSYAYTKVSAHEYAICAALEKAPNPAMDTSSCGSCTSACNYIVTSKR